MPPCSIRTKMFLHLSTLITFLSLTLSGGYSCPPACVCDYDYHQCDFLLMSSDLSELPTTLSVLVLIGSGNSTAAEIADALRGLHRLPYLRQLHVIDLGVKTLANDSFSGSPYLSHLNVIENDLFILQSRALKGLDYLEVIGLTASIVQNEYEFADLPNLRQTRFKNGAVSGTLQGDMPADELLLQMLLSSFGVFTIRGLTFNSVTA
ncbi:leucine-rich glioma-inactivated protein 1-like [Ptychodera flava]|uniref:leucine-rich glioma-inactivated protein 1-like n=1 Tax=Ptychodera flava TaxID=63121 RepID=UPI00396A9159